MGPKLYSAAANFSLFGLLFLSYVPTQQDILYSRKRTTAIHEFNLDIENVPFLFVDVVSGKLNVTKMTNYEVS